MDNLCHTLVGVAFTQAGLKKRTAFATATAALAANIPDLDVLVFATDIPSVEFRRGMTHGVPAQIVLPVLCAGGMWLFGRHRERTPLPVSFSWLLALSYIGVLSHVGLDLLNTYGVRLLSPISQRWFYGDAVFIIDPWLWLILGTGAALSQRWTRRFAVTALVLATLYVSGMVVSARAARAIVLDAWTARAGHPPRALMVGPAPLSPLRKSIIVDTGDAYMVGTFRWLPASVAFDGVATPKNDDSAAVAAAREDRRIRGFLVWSRFPVWDTRTLNGKTQVQLRDMRFRNTPGSGTFTITTTVVSR